MEDGWGGVSTGLPQLTGKRWACGTEPRSVWADVNLLFLSDCTRAKNSPPGRGQGVKAKLGPAGGEPQAQSLPETLLRGPAAGEGPGLACGACLCAQGLQPDLTERTGGSPTVRTNSTALRPLAVGFKHAHTHVCMHKCAYMHRHMCTATRMPGKAGLLHTGTWEENRLSASHLAAASPRKSAGSGAGKAEPAVGPLLLVHNLPVLLSAAALRHGQPQPHMHAAPRNPKRKGGSAPAPPFQRREETEGARVPGGTVST